MRAHRGGCCLVIFASPEFQGPRLFGIRQDKRTKCDGRDGGRDYLFALKYIIIDCAMKKREPPAVPPPPQLFRRIPF